jgi:hypothetical protein
VDSATFLDVADLPPEEALKKIQDFRPPLAFANKYLETQKKLAVLFANSENFLSERRRICQEILKEISQYNP